MGWKLSGAAGIFATFPDALFQYQPDMPFYFAYFLAGWWLYRLRDALPDVDRVWLPTVILGTIAHVAAAYLSETGARQVSAAQLDSIRLSGFTLYAMGSAFTSFGFLGFFQRYVNRPTRVGRYLADTAFWIYLAHQELLMGPVGSLVRPLQLPSWGRTLLSAALTTVIALILFEIFVRRTPLAYLFGPPGPRPKVSSKPEPVNAATEQ